MLCKRIDLKDERREIFMGLLCFEIKEIPDLSLNKYQSLSNSGVEGVLKRHSSFLRQWHGICMESKTSFHLLYVFLPNEKLGKRMKLYFMIQGENDSIKNVKPLIEKSPLSDFYQFVKCEIPLIYFNACTTLVKNERIAEIFNPLSSTTKSIHYVPKWEMNVDCRLYDMFKIMDVIGLSYKTNEPCGYRIDLYPASLMSETREKFSPVLKSLRGENDIKLINNNSNNKRDSYVNDICKEYEDWLGNIETSPHFRINIYGFAGNQFLSKVLLNAVGSEAISKGDFSIAPIKADSDGSIFTLSRMLIQADSYCFYPKIAVLNTWSTSFLLEEVEPFFRLPVLFDGEHIELPRETAPTLFENGIYLGTDNNGFPVKFPVEDLPRHAFFTGTPGSGKTNTMLHIATELKKKNIPFLVLEPAKKEYRALLGSELMKDVYLFSPHLQSYFPLKMNPFEFPRGVRLSDHINSLLEVFQGSFVLEGPTFKFLSSSIQKSYKDLGWDIEDVNENIDLQYPTIEDVYNNLEKEIEKSSYDSELKGNVRAFLQVRLGGLMELDAGEIFNTSISTLKPEAWLYSSTIVELEVLNEQTKNFFVLLVCHYILETLRVNPQEGINPETNQLLPVRHAIFIEEAHNIIAPNSQQSSSDSIDPKISATAYIIKMLAEVRALREAIIIADQLPTALADEVTKNTGLKLVHRLTAQDDREQIGSAISASSLQLEQVASFTKGKALIYYEKAQKPYEIQIAKWEEPKISYNFANDKELYHNIASRKVISTSINYAFDSWIEMHVYPIGNKIIDMQIKHESKESTHYADKVLFESKMKLILNDYKKIKKKYYRLNDLWCLDINHFQGDNYIFQLSEDVKIYFNMLDDLLIKMGFEI